MELAVAAGDLGVVGVRRAVHDPVAGHGTATAPARNSGCWVGGGCWY
jgi:hypothetical protein